MRKPMMFLAVAFAAWSVVAAQCEGLTKSGARCKHKKDGESDYCKQHGPEVKSKKALAQCRALKWDGERCGRKPEGEYLYCSQHRKLGATKPAAK